MPFVSCTSEDNLRQLEYSARHTAGKKKHPPMSLREEVCHLLYGHSCPQHCCRPCMCIPANLSSNSVPAEYFSQLPIMATTSTSASPPKASPYSLGKLLAGFQSSCHNPHGTKQIATCNGTTGCGWQIQCIHPLSYNYTKRITVLTALGCNLSSATHV